MDFRYLGILKGIVSPLLFLLVVRLLGIEDMECNSETVRDNISTPLKCEKSSQSVTKTGASIIPLNQNEESKPTWKIDSSPHKSPVGSSTKTNAASDLSLLATTCQRSSPNKRRSEADESPSKMTLADTKSGPTPIKRPSLSLARIEEVQECGQKRTQQTSAAQEEKLSRQDRLRRLRELIARERCLKEDLKVQLNAIEQEFAERERLVVRERREELRARLGAELRDQEKNLRMESNRRVAVARRELTMLRKLNGLKIDGSAPNTGSTGGIEKQHDAKEKLLREQFKEDLEALREGFAARETAELAENELDVKQTMQADKGVALGARRMASNHDVGRLRRELAEYRRTLQADGVINSELGFRELDLLHDWNASYHLYDKPDRLDSCIKRWKKTSPRGLVDTSFPDVQFTEEQLKILQLVKDQLHSLTEEYSERRVEKRCIVQGKAGSGKSTVIKAITSMVEDALGPGAFLLAAPTGVAAINIGGKTLHSALRLPLCKKKFKPLCDEDISRMTETIRNVRFIIIDEYSMIGCFLLGMVVERCRQLMPNSEEPFGGCFTYLFGDIRQLPPVGDWPLYTTSPLPCKVTQVGREAFRMFTTAFLLTVSQRQADDTFRDALDRLSQADTSDEDYERFCRRFLRNVAEKERQQFGDAMRLYFKNSEADGYNRKRLVAMNRPVALIPAVHNYAMAAAATKTEAHGLPVTLHLAVGARVMLRKNLWTDSGLVNGAVGTVVNLVYGPGQGPPEDQPLAVLVRFDHYQGPCLEDGSVPVPAIEERWRWERNDEYVLSRTQFPLSLAWAVTVHKAQGLSLSKVVLNLGDDERQPGLTYVGISRSRTWDGLVFEENFPKRRLTYFRWDERLLERMDAEKRLFGVQ